MGKWTRRAFITAGVLVGGGILVGVAVRPGNVAKKLAGKVAGDGETLVHAFVKIDKDNIVTVMVPHSEMGQGAQTALSQMLADELDAAWDQVRFEEAPALAEYANYSVGRGYLLKDVDIPNVVIPSLEGVMMRLADTLDMQVTGGSMSVRVTGVYAMRVAGAATRQMLKQAAAERWGVPVDDIITENSMLIHKAKGLSEPYAAFAEDAASKTPSYTPTLKEPKDFTIMGRSVQRLDIPSKVDGTAQFALDVRLPDMVYATVRRSPIFGGRISSVDDKAARTISGVIDVVEIPESTVEAMIGGYSVGESVAVVADGYWAAQKGLRLLDIQWDGVGNDKVSTKTIQEQHDRDIASDDDRKSDRKAGDVDGALAGSKRIVEAEYRVPYLAHTCMEPLNATARVSEDHVKSGLGAKILLVQASRR